MAMQKTTRYVETLPTTRNVQKLELT